MDLYDIRGGRLGVITEEALSGEEHVEEVVSNRKEPRGVSTFQRFSVDTDDSLQFEPYVPSDEDEPPSPTGAEDGHDDVFEERGPEGDEDGHDLENQKPEDEISTTTSIKLQEKVVDMENFAGHLEEIFLTVEENFGRQEQHLEQHYNDVLQTLSQRYDERAASLEEEKKNKLEALYTQLLGCGQTLEASKELIESAQGIYRSQDKRLFLKAVMPAMKRIEEFAKEEVDLKLSTALEFNTPLADLSDVRTMMDSINIVPGLIYG